MMNGFEEVFIPPRPSPRLGHEWVIERKLGEGGGGRTYLWNLVKKADRKVVDRVVLKYTDVHPLEVITEGPGKGQLKEVFLARALAPNGTPPDRMYTVPVLASEHCSWKLSTWRIYTPYFGFGDLDDLINMQQDHGTFRQIPEPFAWYLLFRLASAVMAMDNALCDSTTDYKIVHADLKPLNIFMGAPGSLGKSACFPAYPPAYVGDFGNSEVTYSGDPQSNKCVGMCTPGWAAPEIASKVPQSQRRVWQRPASSYTNVWQIGWIMIRVLGGDMKHYGDVNWEALKDHHYAPKYKESRVPAGALKRNYSHGLLEVIHACVAFKTTSRPSPGQLLSEINKRMPKHIQGMDVYGTKEWFTAQHALDNPTSSRSSSTGSDAASMASSLVSGIKALFCMPAARARRQGRSPTVSGRVSRVIASSSPFSRSRSQMSSLQRRQAIVSRQIREGLTPALLRYVSADASDDKFVLDDVLKLHHPKRHQHTLKDYWEQSEPLPTMYRPDIDDVDAWYKHTKLKHRAYGYGVHVEQKNGRDVFNFRKAGHKAGDPAPVGSGLRR
jgi:serine/threonine protein kinase